MRKKSRFSRGSLKFHAIGLSVVVGMVLLLFAFFGPDKKPAAGPAGEVISDRYIQIDRATWGRNCDPYVEQAIHDWQTNATTSKTNTPQPAMAQTNNVLSVVSDACNGKLACSIVADSELLKVDPMPTCFKRLTVSYRCYSFDRLSGAETGQGDTLKIDCHEKAAPPVKTQ